MGRSSRALLLAISGLCLIATTAAAADGGLEFVETSTLRVAFAGDSATTEQLLALRNAGPEDGALEFSLALSADGDPLDDAVSIEAEPATIDRETVDWYTLTFSITNKEAFKDGAEVVGYLVASGADIGAASRSVAFFVDQRTIALGDARVTIPGVSLLGGPGTLLLAGLVVAFLLVAIRAALGRFNLLSQFGTPTFKWSDSFASTFTAVGALLGLVLGASGLVPDSPELLPKTQYMGLNVFFGGLILVTAFAFEAFRGGTGKTLVLMFLFASLLLFWAVFGELLTLLVLITDVVPGLKSGALSLGFTVLSVAALILMLIYGWKAMGRQYAAGTSPPPDAEDNSTELGTWALP